MRAQGNGIGIRYEIEGQGPWLVMSHSLACDLTMWNAQASAFRDHFKVLRFERAGMAAPTRLQTRTRSINWPTTSRRCSMAWVS